MEKHCTASPIFPKCKKWNGDAELKGFVKCTDLRVRRIGPLRCQRSRVILVTRRQAGLASVGNDTVKHAAH